MATPENYINELNEAYAKLYKDNYPNLTPPTFKIRKGKKYLKIMECDDGRERSVHCFLDFDGNIYKAASYNAPAKGIRGNINDDKKPLLGVEYYIRM